MSSSENFGEHVREGLQKTQPHLSSRYLYDERGSRLFQDIMGLDEYYLTRAEFQILEAHACGLGELIASSMGGEGDFELVELGAGDGTKTKLLLSAFLRAECPFTYRPIDISADILAELTADLQQRYPTLRVDPLAMSYDDALGELQGTAARKVVLFMGSNIGNFSLAEARAFCGSVAAALHPGDLFVVGVDLRKDPRVILAAYDDPGGVTAAFNLNLLVRINRELGGDFDLGKWRFYPTYNPETGEVRSYLYPVEAQTVRIAALDLERHFGPEETIHTEVSRKYTFDELRGLADASGCEPMEHYTDPAGYFTDVVWRKR